MWRRALQLRRIIGAPKLRQSYAKRCSFRIEFLTIQLLMTNCTNQTRIPASGRPQNVGDDRYIYIICYQPFLSYASRPDVLLPGENVAIIVETVLFCQSLICECDAGQHLENKSSMIKAEFIYCRRDSSADPPTKACIDLQEEHIITDFGQETHTNEYPQGMDGKQAFDLARLCSSQIEKAAGNHLNSY